MSTKTLYRASGLSLLVGVVLGTIGYGLQSVLFPDFQSVPLPVLLLSFIGSMLVIIGLPGLAARQASRAGWLGFAGFVLMLLGIFLFSSLSFVQIIAQQLLTQLTQVAPKVAASDGPSASAMVTGLLASVLFTLGGILLGIAILRTRVWPRWTGLFLLLGVVLNLGSFPLPGIMSGIIGTVASVLTYAAVGWIGYNLLTSGAGEVAVPNILTSSQAQA
jgi:hypothetical protein